MRVVFIIMLLFPFWGKSQDVLSGVVANSGDNEGIHVFNKTAQKYTITDQRGEFKIIARVNDTVVLSAVQFKLHTLVVTTKMLKEKQFIVMEDHVNELDEVFIKPKLSGDLLADSKRIKTKDQVTAKTLGLPNAEVKPPTQAERRLQTASNFSPSLGGSLGGIGGAVGLDAVINAISGRTKKLKKIVKDERKTIREQYIIEEYGDVIIKDFHVPTEELHRFVFYASEDELFKSIVSTKSYIIIYDFMQVKANNYLKINKP